MATGAVEPVYGLSEDE
uniref:Uncharacterized protein n=1 Tax=Sphenodon punctatus TaxID=8508 RepID=A0A8D0HEJ5_SPHPU